MPAPAILLGRDISIKSLHLVSCEYSDYFRAISHPKIAKSSTDDPESLLYCFIGLSIC